ncbi:MAG: hypothetical protein U5L04_01885 [Trueperaceae bacterium]|nr:hypothetical protein [Trueperaceae bacterium]
MDTTSPPSAPNVAAAEHYQTARLWSGIVGIGVGLGMALIYLVYPLGWVLVPATVAGAALLALAMFGLHALVTLPIDFYAGYYVEKRYDLAERPLSAWAGDYLRGIVWHALFFTGAALVLVLLQAATPSFWSVVVAVLLFPVALLLYRYRAGVLPPGLVGLEPIDDAKRAVIAKHAEAHGLPLPPVVSYHAGDDRSAQGGWVGATLWLSRGALDLPDDALGCAASREIVARELGHPHRTAIISALWLALGVLIAGLLVTEPDPRLLVLRTTAAVTLWSFAGLFVLPALGRRMTLQVDRAYLARAIGHGDDPRTAAERLKMTLTRIVERNLFHRELGEARQRVFHPLPSLSRRLTAIDDYLVRQTATQQTPESSPKQTEER